MSRLAAGVPAGWFFRPAELALGEEQVGRKTAQQVNGFLANLQPFTILVDWESHAGLIGRVLGLTRTHSLPLVDAALIELAARLGVPLATTDPALTRAATAAGVALFAP